MKEIEEDEYKGWIRLYRKSLKNGWLQNHKFWAFWCYCLLRANHKETKVTIGYQHVNLKPGQFIFGRKKAASELKLSEQEVRTCLKNLEKYKNITINTTNKFSVITINKWEEYQPPKDEGNQQNSQQLTINQPTSNQQVTTDKNDKNVKNGKKEEIGAARSKRKQYDIPPTFEEVSFVFNEKGHPELAMKFFNHYESNGWKVGKNKMVKLVAAISGWISRQNDYGKTPITKPQQINPGLTDVNAINDKILYEKMPGNLMPGDRERIAKEHPDWVMGEM